MTPLTRKAVVKQSSPQRGSRPDDITAALKLAPDPTDHPAVCEYVHTLADLDLALLLIRPGQKGPFDARTTAQKIADDNAFQEAAKAAGRRNWSGLKSPSGLTLATSDHDVLDRYLNEYLQLFTRIYPDGFAVNLAVVAGPSGLLIADCDTRSQTGGFLTYADMDPDAAPTVMSPGSQDMKGNWVHEPGNGHYWFTVPEGVELPTNAASYTDPETGFQLKWGRTYVLIPPSSRPEGPYEAVGEVREATPELLDGILRLAPAQRRVADRSVVSRDPTTIDAWSRSTGWEEILVQLGWIPSGPLDSCGCPVWTAPGDHGTPRSATAHEPGCSYPDYDSENPPLHIWTDSPGEPFASNLDEYGVMRRTLSKLQTMALVQFHNKMGDAMDANGLIPDPTTLGGSGSTAVVGEAASIRGEGRQIRLRPMSQITDDAPTWVWTYDGVGRIMRGTLSIFAGRPAAGKSTAARWFAAGFSKGLLEGCFFGAPQTVAYVGTEESYEHLVKPSLRAAGADLDRVVQVIVEKDDREIRLLAADDEHQLTDAFRDAAVTVVIVDPLMSTINGKADINRNNEVREALEPWARIAQAINGVVIGVAHLVKAPPNGDVLAAIQGSSAFGEVARSAFGFAKDPDSDVRVMSQAKNSAGREDLSVEYRIVETKVTTDTGKKANVARFEIVGTSEITVSDVMRDQRGGMSGNAKAEVIMWLTKYLASGPRWAAQGYEDAAAAGFSEDQIKRGRTSCGIKSIRAKVHGRWYWATSEQEDAGELPEDADVFGGVVLG